MEVGQPSQLAKLPRAGIAGDGKIQFCQVFAVQDGYRKKRQEVCVVVDGNSVNIIEVKQNSYRKIVLISGQVINGRNVASWPVPPDTVFLCEPLSERMKVKNAPHRRTWCVVKRRGHRAVECYEETEVDKETCHSTSSCVIEPSAAKVIALQSFGSNVAVVVQDDGRIFTISYGQEVPQSSFSIQDSAAPLTVIAAQILKPDAVQKSVLKSRPDLASNLSHNSIIVVAAYTTNEIVQNKPSVVRLGICVFDISKNLGNDNMLEPITFYEIGCSAVNTVTRRVRFTADARRMQISDKASTMIFDLTTTHPLHLVTRKHLMNDAISDLELANNIFLSVSSDKFHIYNANFTSVLTTLPRNKTGSKRKRDGSMPTDISIIAYFSQLKRVVAADNKFMYAIDIHAENAAIRPFQKSSLLIGNLLRGAPNTNVVSESVAKSISHIGKLKLQSMPDQWQKFTKELDVLAAKQDVPGFENKLLQAFNQKSFSGLSQSSVPARVIDYVLSKIFQCDQATPGMQDVSHRLKVVLLAPRLVKWLIQGGLLEESRVFRALDMEVSILLSSVGRVTQAIFDSDTDLIIVQDYIKHSPHINTTQLCSIIKFLLDTTMLQSDKHMQKMLRHEMKVEMDETRNTHTVAVGVGPDELTASTAATICLSFALQRLALAGSITVSKRFRRFFDQREMLILIQFLRQQLFFGGYTRLVENWKSHSTVRIPPSDAEEQQKNPNPQISLKDLVLLLDGCLDALGLVGILGSEEHEAFLRDMLPELLSEITTATKAVEDSTHLEGFVRETLRYAESVEKQPFEVRSRIQNKSTRSNHRGEVVTLYAEPDIEETGVNAGSALPLSLKSAEDINKFKVRKGGGQVYRRSAREMGMLKDRLKSSYSFERLIL